MSRVGERIVVDRIAVSDTDDFRVSFDPGGKSSHGVRAKGPFGVDRVNIDVDEIVIPFKGVFFGNERQSRDFARRFPRRLSERS